MRKALFILGMLDDRDVDWFASVGQKVQVSPGETIIKEGSEPEYLFLVLDGALAIYVEAVGDRPVAESLAGEILGELSFVDARPASATVKGAQTSNVLRMRRSQIFARMEDEPAFGMRFYRALAAFLADRLRERTEKKMNGSTDDLKEDVGADDEVEPQLLDGMALAAARFNWILNRLKTGASHPSTELGADAGRPSRN